MFDADRPIVLSTQDRLGRAPFAKSLARCILDHSSPESLVVGLYGGWGVGKTSLINLTLEELQFAGSNMSDEERPIILNFSPWSYSGQGQLIYSFFRRLSSALRQSPYLENADDIIHLLELYVSFFTHKPVPKSLRPSHSILGKIFKRKLITQEIGGWESGRDLTDVKAELNELLSKQKHKIIIIIDNISRLEKEEIKQIFQIVKSMGDYANTVYLLALDKQQVIHALDELEEVGVEEYLEKVIQLPFEIPPISHQDLEVLFLDRLNKVLEDVPLEAWNKDYWGDLYSGGLKFFFHNVRDISHYINTLSFSYHYVKDVVNPVDFFGITAIEIFAPSIYGGIRDNKDLFTDLMDDVYRLTPEKIVEDKSRCDEILNRGASVPSEIIIQLLVRLFPRLLTMYRTQIPFYHSEIIASKNKRICSPDAFDAYFRLSMPMGIMPDTEVNAILAMANDPEGFALALLRLNKDDTIIKFLDLMDNAGVIKIPTKYVANAVNALIDGADLFSEGKDSLVSFNTFSRVHRILHQLLRRFDSSKERFELLRNAITKATNSLYIIVHELTVQGQEHIETEDTFLPLDQRDVTEEELHILEKLAVGKIIYWADIGRLFEHPKLIPILYAWKRWGDEAACTQYVAQVTTHDKGLIAFLVAALHDPIEEALSKNEKTADGKVYIAVIENFIDPQLLVPHVKMIFEDLEFEKLAENEQLAVLIFLDLMKVQTLKIIPQTSV